MIYRIISVASLSALAFVVYKFQKYKYESDIANQQAIVAARADALKKSRSTITGNVTEALAPLLPGFPYNGRDAKHMGSPIDFLILDGMSTYRDTGEGEIKVVLVDVKTGDAQLTPVEKAIKEAVEDGRVEWATLRMDLDRGGLVPVKHRKKKINTEELAEIGLKASTRAKKELRDKGIAPVVYKDGKIIEEPLDMEPRVE